MIIREEGFTGIYRGVFPVVRPSPFSSTRTKRKMRGRCCDKAETPPYDSRHTQR